MSAFLAHPIWSHMSESLIHTGSVNLVVSFSLSTHPLIEYKGERKRERESWDTTDFQDKTQVIRTEREKRNTKMNREREREGRQRVGALNQWSNQLLPKDTTIPSAFPPIHVFKIFISLFGLFSLFQLWFFRLLAFLSQSLFPSPLSHPPSSLSLSLWEQVSSSPSLSQCSFPTNNEFINILEGGGRRRKEEREKRWRKSWSLRNGEEQRGGTREDHNLMGICFSLLFFLFLFSLFSSFHSNPLWIRRFVFMFAVCVDAATLSNVEMLRSQQSGSDSVFNN